MIYLFIAYNIFIFGYILREGNSVRSSRTSVCAGLIIISIAVSSWTISFEVSGRINSPSIRMACIRCTISTTTAVLVSSINSTGTFTHYQLSITIQLSQFIRTSREEVVCTASYPTVIRIVWIY